MDLISLQDTLSQRKITPEGYMRVPARVARIGVLPYTVGELRAGGLPGAFPDRSDLEIVQVLRDASVLFDSGVLSSLVEKPVTLTHPDNFVNSGNVRAYQVGFSSTGAKRDGDYLSVPLLIQDKRAVQTIESGINQVSLGQDATITIESGTHPVHGLYDAKITQIKVNHIAIESQGRAGPSVKVADKKKELEIMAAENATRVIDGVSYDMPIQSAQAVGKLEGELNGARTQLKDTQAKLAETQKVNDKLQGALDASKAKLVELEDEGKQAAVIDAAVQARVALVDRIKGSLPKFEVGSGKTNRELKVEAIAQIDDSFGDLKDKTDAYVDGVFEAKISAEPAKVKDALAVNVGTNAQISDAAQAAVTAEEQFKADNASRFSKFNGRVK